MVDAAHKLTPEQVAALDAKLKAFERETGDEFAVVSVQSLGGLTVEEYANRLFQQWGIGKAKQDNGLLFLWAIDERKVRFEVGYGLEGVFNDGKAGSIIRSEITPRFKSEDWFAGLTNGTNAAMAALRGQSFKSSDAQLDEVVDMVVLFIVIVVLAVIVLLIVFVIFQSIRNPYSGGSYSGSSGGGGGWASSSGSDSDDGGSYGGGSSGGGGASGSY